MFPKLFKIHLRQTLPRLRHRLTSGRNLDTPDEGVHLLLQAGIARDWMGAKEMIRKSKKTPHQLFRELSRKVRPNWRRRLHNWFAGLMGDYSYDPHQKELRELEGKGR